MVINTLTQGLPTPQLTETALGRPAGTGPYLYSASYPSTPSTTSAGLSTFPFAVGANTTENQRVFPGASGRTSGVNLVSDSAVFNTDSAIGRNATQMKRALSEVSSHIAAGGVHKKAKGDMDPVCVAQLSILPFKRIQES